MGDPGRANRLHEIAVRTKHGDRDALRQLLADTTIKNVVYHVANERVGSTNADDIYQEVCLRIHQKIRTWQERSITAWVKRITENTCTDFLIKTKPNKFVTTNQIPEKMTEPEQLKIFLAQEEKESIQRILREMGEPCEHILRLCLFEGFDYQEIMEILHLKKTFFFETRKKCLKTLMKKMQKLLRT